MKNATVFLSGALALLLTGCASTRQFVPLPDQSKEIEDPGKGRIYVIRAPKPGGRGVVDVFDGDKYVGVTTPKGFLSWEREPGVAKVQTEDPGGFSMDIDVKPGNRYYLVQDFHWFRTANFHVVDPESGQSLLAKTFPPRPAPPPKEYDPKDPKTPHFMRNDWGMINAFGVLYDLRGGVLARYQVEKVFHRGPHSFRLVKFSAGVYGTSGAKIRVNYQDGSSRKGDLHIQSFPMQLGISYGRTHGSFIGRWGVGASVYPFSGDIDMRDGYGPYKAKGTGVGIVFPFEGLIKFSRKSLVIRLDEELHFPFVRPNFNDRYGGYIKSVWPMGFWHFGISIGKLY